MAVVGSQPVALLVGDEVLPERLDDERTVPLAPVGMEVLLRHPRQVGLEDEVVVGLHQVHRGHPPAGPQLVPAAVAEEGVEEAVELRLKRVELARR